MRNVSIVVRPDETPSDLIEQICEMEKIRYDDYFAFSAIMIDDAKEKKLKINCLEPSETNPYTPQTLINSLMSSLNTPKFVVPPLENYLVAYKPMMCNMVDKIYSYYKKLIPDRDDLMSILYLSIVKLHNAGYYIHKKLIHKTFMNALNLEIRKSKAYSNCLSSLDAEIGADESGQTITLLDQLECPVSTQEARRQFTYTEDDYWEDMFNMIKEIMLQDMSQLAFDRILIQLKTKTIDVSTSHKLAKYRNLINPGYNPRPNNKGDNHYTRRPK